MRRFYTWKSLGFMVFLTVALLAVWHWAFDERVQVVRSWDFARLTPEQWDWQFPPTRPLGTFSAAVFLSDGRGQGPTITLRDIAPRDIDKVRVTGRITDVATGRDRPLYLDLVWWRAVDAAPTGADRSREPAGTCSFRMADYRDPHIVTAELGPQGSVKGAWGGDIGAVQIRAYAAASSEQGCVVEIFEIVFLKQLRRSWANTEAGDSES